MIGLFCHICCAIISICFLVFKAHSSLEMFYCIAIATFYLRAASQDLDKINRKCVIKNDKINKK